MSLVVGRIVDGEVYIESDSKLTCLKGGAHSPLEGILKVIILHPHVCICFAGNPYSADKALVEFFEQKIKDINLLLELLKKYSADGKTDFAVASIIKREPRLFKVANNEIQRDMQNFYLGDKGGFELYQQKFHESNPVLIYKR